jgi:hypothetical protein
MRTRARRSVSDGFRVPATLELSHHRVFMLILKM